MSKTRSARGRPTNAREHQCPFSLEHIRNVQQLENGLERSNF
jgi:hypothetical protein